MIYPEFTDSFWNFRHALKFVGKRAAMPPVGLLTVSNMLPVHWEKKLVDLNVRSVRKEMMEWADLVMISAMNAQRASADRVVEMVHRTGKTIIAGGPLFSGEPGLWKGRVDHIVVGEAENVLPELIADIQSGDARFLYKADHFPSLAETPVPDWGLIEKGKYHTMGVQFSRGCPHQCDFCNVTALFGNRVRVKTAEQVIAELDALYEIGWRAGVFFADDNLIGNKTYLKTSLLPELIKWRKNRRKINFQTETSILLADDEELMELMVTAGFNTVFIGIETDDEESLLNCSKKQNLGRDLLEDVRKIQRKGLEVEAGFIVGFDNDTATVFQRQSTFIQKSGIVTAMVAMLQAPPGTGLRARLEREGRIRGEVTDGTDGTTNIEPSMGLESLKTGYSDLVNHLYSPGAFYKRIRVFLREFKPVGNMESNLSVSRLVAFPKTVFSLGIVGGERLEYWKLLFWTFFTHPTLLPIALKLAVYGHHFSRTLRDSAIPSVNLSAV